MRLIDITGSRFGRLVVLAFAGRRPTSDTLWFCKCDCGERITVESYRLRTGHTKSCGCLRADGKHRWRHGKSRTKIHYVWMAMMNRCYRSNMPNYHRYGGRGIKVCERWHKFENFYADMGDPPLGSGSAARPNLTLDRINNDGDYSLENCRWTDYKTQAKNSIGRWRKQCASQI